MKNKNRKEIKNCNDVEELLKEKNLTNEEIEKANYEWNLIETMLEMEPNCDIEVIRKTVDMCIIHIKRDDTYYIANTEQTLTGLKDILNIEMYDSRGMILTLQTENKKLRKEILQLKNKIIAVEEENRKLKENK